MRLTDWVLIFVAVAAAAAVFAFGGIVQGLVTAATIVFGVSIALFVVGILYEDLRHWLHQPHTD
jgi:uncharacterized membrane protein YtjA (UPF0391 family)